MDRPSQEPVPQPAPPTEAAEAAESPLSFPVEAPRPAGPEPGAGADPLAFPAAAKPHTEPPLFPAETTATPPTEPPLFPAETTAKPPTEPPLFPAETTAKPPTEPPLFPAETTAKPPTEPPLFPAETTAKPPTEPPLFPAETTAKPPTEPPLFPAETTAQPPSSTPWPFPVAELPGPAAVPPPVPVAAPAPAPEPAPAPAVPWLFRLGPPVLAAVAALLAVGGLFLPLFQVAQELDFRQGFLDARLTVTQTAWGHRVEVSGQGVIERTGAPVGILVIVAVVVLAVAAFAASSRPNRGLTRWLLSTGAAFTAGVVATVGLGGFELEAMVGGQGKLEATTGPGMWLLAAATVLAAVAAVLGHLPLRKPAGSPGWADPAVAYADTPTPPSGVAITVLPPSEQAEPGDPRLR
ncbi:hypothetical protein [Amycolatopsis sp. MtRt-6]|uniref:hypothetical protein n=1 Tax=Amycolatopsis sp. MtRt-6 TaxID=2792782 RepID=UPI001F5DCB45|nr:hypothetical protein [Amycolatopsis sp. MtRt-6]